MVEIKKNAASMKGGLANRGRCPKCTLKPPCKHFESMEALNFALAGGDSMMPSVSGVSSH